MKKIDTIVVAPHFYTMEGAGVGYHSDAAMAVDGGKILKVGNRAEILAEYTAEEMITWIIIWCCLVLSTAICILHAILCADWPKTPTVG